MRRGWGAVGIFLAVASGCTVGGSVGVVEPDAGPGEPRARASGRVTLYLSDGGVLDREELAVPARCVLPRAGGAVTLEVLGADWTVRVDGARHAGEREDPARDDLLIDAADAHVAVQIADRSVETELAAERIVIDGRTLGCLETFAASQWADLGTDGSAPIGVSLYTSCARDGVEYDVSLSFSDCAFE